MGLSEKFKTVSLSQTGLPCGVAKIMESMGKEDLKALDEVLYEQLPVGKRISNSKIHQILVEEGYEVAPSSIAQHRRKQCRCFVGVAVQRTKAAK